MQISHVTYLGNKELVFENLNETYSDILKEKMEFTGPLAHLAKEGEGSSEILLNMTMTMLQLENLSESFSRDLHKRKKALLDLETHGITSHAHRLLKCSELFLKSLNSLESLYQRFYPEESEAQYEYMTARGFFFQHTEAESHINNDYGFFSKNRLSKVFSFINERVKKLEKVLKNKNKIEFLFKNLEFILEDRFLFEVPISSILDDTGSKNKKTTTHFFRKETAFQFLKETLAETNKSIESGLIEIELSKEKIKECETTYELKIDQSFIKKNKNKILEFKKQFEKDILEELKDVKFTKKDESKRFNLTRKIEKLRSIIEIDCNFNLIEIPNEVDFDKDTPIEEIYEHIIKKISVLESTHKKFIANAKQEIEQKNTENSIKQILYTISSLERILFSCPISNTKIDNTSFSTYCDTVNRKFFQIELKETSPGIDEWIREIEEEEEEIKKINKKNNRKQHKLPYDTPVVKNVLCTNNQTLSQPKLKIKTEHNLFPLFKTAIDKADKNEVGYLKNSRWHYAATKTFEQIFSKTRDANCHLAIIGHTTWHIEQLFWSRVKNKKHNLVNLSGLFNPRGQIPAICQTLSCGNFWSRFPILEQKKWHADLIFGREYMPEVLKRITAHLFSTTPATEIAGEIEHLTRDSFAYTKALFGADDKQEKISLRLTPFSKKCLSTAQERALWKELENQMSALVASFEGREETAIYSYLLQAQCNVTLLKHNKESLDESKEQVSWAILSVRHLMLIDLLLENLLLASCIQRTGYYPAHNLHRHQLGYIAHYAGLNEQPLYRDFDMLQQKARYPYTTLSEQRAAKLIDRLLPFALEGIDLPFFPLEQKTRNSIIQDIDQDIDKITCDSLQVALETTNGFTRNSVSSLIKNG